MQERGGDKKSDDLQFQRTKARVAGRGLRCFAILTDLVLRVDGPLNIASVKTEQFTPECYNSQPTSSKVGEHASSTMANPEIFNVLRASTRVLRVLTAGALAMADAVVVNEWDVQGIWEHRHSLAASSIGRCTVLKLLAAGHPLASICAQG